MNKYPNNFIDKRFDCLNDRKILFLKDKAKE